MLALEFAAALAERARAGLDGDAAHETRRTLLNALGVAIGASQAAETDRLAGVACRLGGRELPPPGRVEPVDRFWAACLTGFAAHLDDFDDTHLATVIHPGAATLGAWYAIGALEPGDPAAALAAFAMGVESQLRVGLAMSPSHYDDGWHITGTCGVVGAAVAAGLLMGLSDEALARAIGLACQMPLGHREAFGTPIKPFHAGKAAANGLFAAELARRGVDPGDDVLERSPGFFGALAHAHDPEPLSAADVAKRQVLLDNTYKPFPCGIVAHPAIEAAIAIHDALGSPGEVADVEVWCNPLVPELMGRPDCATGLEARFCAVHGVAVGLVLGRAGLAEFSDALARSPEVRALRARVRLLPDERCGRESAEVRVRLGDGRLASHLVEVAAGSRERPLGDAALFGKFEALVEPVLPGRAAALAEIVAALGAGAGPADLAVALGGVATGGSR